MHEPRDVAYVDLIGPIQNSGSKFRYIVTAVDGFSRYLATRPVLDKRAQTVAGALHSMFTAELGFPARVIADRGSEFVAADTRLAMEKLGVRLQFIPAGEHQENLVERVHSTIWKSIRAIRIDGDITSWRIAIAEATYAYNIARHQTTGFTPYLLHFAHKVPSPGLMHPDTVPANPEPATRESKMQFTQKLQDVKRLLTGMVERNTAKAHQQAARYYRDRTIGLAEGTWVYVYRPGTGAPQGDQIANRKLAVEWARPYRFLRMINDTLALVAKVDPSGQVEKTFEVHGSKIRPINLNRQQSRDITPPQGETRGTASVSRFSGIRLCVI